jgi:hypothetical protein
MGGIVHCVRRPSLRRSGVGHRQRFVEKGDDEIFRVLLVVLSLRVACVSHQDIETFEAIE